VPIMPLGGRYRSSSTTVDSKSYCVYRPIVISWIGHGDYEDRFVITGSGVVITGIGPVKTQIGAVDT
jgi:hypothetical protein